MFMTVNTQLTKRECEILNLVCQGFRYKEVADRLGLSQCTVAAHMQNMLVKTRTHSAVNLVSKLSGWRPE